MQLSDNHFTLFIGFLLLFTFNGCKSFIRSNKVDSTRSLSELHTIAISHIGMTDKELRPVILTIKESIGLDVEKQIMIYDNFLPKYFSIRVKQADIDNIVKSISINEENTSNNGDLAPFGSVEIVFFSESQETIFLVKQYPYSARTIKSILDYLMNKQSETALQGLGFFYCNLVQKGYPCFTE